MVMFALKLLRFKLLLNILTPRKILGFHGGDYEECRLL
jgi:hypothetical protein